MSTGGGTPAKTDQVSKVELPPWVAKAGEENYNLAKQVSDRPLTQWEGPTVADPSAMTKMGWDQILKSIGSAQPFIDRAIGMLSKSANLQDRASPLYDRSATLYDESAQRYRDTDSLFREASDLQTKGVGVFDQAGGVLGRAEADLDASKPYYDRASGAFDESGKLQNEAAGIYRGTTGPLDIAGHLNPYTEEVEKRAIANAQSEADRRQLQIRDAQRKAGAFGGSRGEIESGVAAGESTRNIGDLSAALRKAGFDTATANAIADRAGVQAGAAGILSAASGKTATGTGYLNTAAGLRDTASGRVNVAGGLTNTGSGILNAAAGKLGTASGLQTSARGVADAAGGNLNTATGLLSASDAAGRGSAAEIATANALKAAEGQDIGQLLTAGADQRSIDQANIDAAMKKFYEMRDYPLEQLNTRLAALGLTPYGKTETTNKTSTSEDKGLDWASILLGGAKIGASIYGASDRSLKTDIEKLTDDDIPLYAYRYKGDPKHYPKVVGPMAQDIEKKFPKAVKRVGGKRVIDYNNLLEALA